MSRGQSLKGISILAQGSHRRWIPWVTAPRKPNPEGIVYSVPKRTGFAEHDSGGWFISIPEIPLVEFHIVLEQDPSQFLLECLVAMMLFLISNVFNQRGEVLAADGECSITSLP